MTSTAIRGARPGCHRALGVAYVPDRSTALAGDGDTGLKHCRGTSGQNPRDRRAGGETSFILLLMFLVLVSALPGLGLSRFCGGSTVAHGAGGLSTTRWYYYQGAAGPGRHHAMGTPGCQWVERKRATYRRRAAGS